MHVFAVGEKVRYTVEFIREHFRSDEQITEALTWRGTVRQIWQRSCEVQTNGGESRVYWNRELQKV